MPKYRFYTICPVCFEGDRYYWVHADDKGDDYIWDNCDLECNSCHNRSFILKHKFKCGMKDHNSYESIDKYSLISAISQLSNIPDLTPGSRKAMLKILRESS